METLVDVREVQWVLAMDASSVVEIGKRQGCTFLVHPYVGMIQKPKAAVGWVYVPYGSDGTVIPEEGIRRLRFLKQAGVRASQVIIGHEIEVASEDESSSGSERQSRISPLAVVGVIGVVAAAALGAAALVTLAAPAVVAAPVVAPVAAPVAATSFSALGAVGLLAGATLVDPSLVIVLEGTGQWVQVFSWVEA